MLKLNIFRRMKKRANRNGKGEAVEVYHALELMTKTLNSLGSKVEALEAKDGGN